MQKIKAIALLSALMISGVASADLNTGLVAHWSFDDCTAKDVSGHGYDGIINGNPQCVDSIAGKGLLLNGTSDYVEIADAPDFNSPKFSISMWASLNELHPDLDGSNMLFNKESQYEVGIKLDSKKIGFTVNTTPQVTWVWNEANFSPKIASLFFVTLSFDGNKGTLYLNGKKYQNTVYNANIQATTNCLRLGRRGCWDGPYALESYFNGTIDEVRYYNRTLTNSEITELYNKGLSIKGTLQSLGAHTVICKNETTGQVINIASNKTTAYACEAKGLKVNTGETASIFIKGAVQ